MPAVRYPLPDLFTREKLRLATALYAVGIPKLLWRGEAEEALRQLRLVRRFARQHDIATRHSEWTRSFELEALIVLGRGEAAWRLVRRALRETFPALAAKPPSRRVARMESYVRNWEVPAAYFWGRLAQATEAMEAWLELGLKQDNAYELRFSIFNGDEHPNPNVHVRVTLFHLYRDAGRQLSDWPHWRKWVAKLHPGLFKLCKLTPDQLAADDSLIGTFHARLRRAERERRTAFVTFGQKDLLEPKARVLERQKHAQKRLDEKPTSSALEFHSKQAQYFPWLKSPAEGVAPGTP
jgi:hypothetical protein